MRFPFIFLALFILVQSSFAQSTKKNDKKKENTEELSLENDTLPNMEYRLASDSAKKAEFLAERKQKAAKKKRKHKKIYFGIKTRVLSVRREGGDNIIEIAQFIAPTFLLNNPYQQDVYYYDRKAGKIKHESYYTLSAKLKKGLEIYLLHGRYERIKNGVTEWEGFYYKGLTHDLWKQYDKNNILIEKLTYDMGFSRESRISYYDAGEKKIKEVLPVEHKLLHGNYYRFHENGAIAETGEYANNEKVGIWTEFYENRQKKKQTQYTPEYKWHTPEEAYMMMEWDKYGKVTYDYQKEKKK